MSRSLVRLFATVLATVALAAAAGASVSAQDAVPSHPSHIHAGSCAELDPNPTYPLTNVAVVSPDAALGSVESATTSIDATLDDLVASPYAINVHESDENVANYIACGDLTAPVVDGVMLVPLIEQNGSGYSGIAVLKGASDGYGGGGVEVSVYLAHGLTGGQVAAAADVATPSEVAISIQDFAFNEAVIEIPVGTTVTWTNNDSAQHTTTANDGAWDSGILSQGGTFSFTFTEAGTYDYICSLHPSMTGQIVVS